MANVTTGVVNESAPRRPIVPLSETPSGSWRAAFDAYVAWAKGSGPAPPGTAAETHFATAAQNSQFTVTDARVEIDLPPGATYSDVRSFVENAIAYANSQAP